MPLRVERPRARVSPSVENILGEIALYDLIGYFVPGALVVWALISALGVGRNPPSITVAIGAVFFFGTAYITGHLIQTVASSLIHLEIEINTLYKDEPWFKAELLRAHGERFGYAPGAGQASARPSEKMIFKLSHTYAQVRKIDSYVEILQARLAFFRGLRTCDACCRRAHVFQSVANIQYGTEPRRSARRAACYRLVARLRSLSGFSYVYDGPHVPHVLRRLHSVPIAQRGDAHG